MRKTQKNGDKIKKQVKHYQHTHRKQLNEQMRNWRKIPINRIITNVRTRTNSALQTKSKHTDEYLKCTYEFLYKHLESQFTDGMTWENYGEWQVDHIVPIKWNKPTEQEQIHRLGWYNLQPLWKVDNLAKLNNAPSYDEIIKYETFYRKYFDEKFELPFSV